MMKKTAVFLCLLFLAAVIIYFRTVGATKNIPEVSYYLNAYDLKTYPQLKNLQKALKDQNITAILSGKGHFQSGKYNIYAALDSTNLPEVLDKNAINILWLPKFDEAESPEKLRPFDVIVVENIPSFQHLKAINVRTAYIPPAINISNYTRPAFNGKLMYYGDHTDGFSLTLFLAGPTDLKIDVFDKEVDSSWDEKEIMKKNATPHDFRRYTLVLTDQSEEDIRDEIVNKRIIEIIEQGGLPYIRFNNGVAKMFGEAVPMYASEGEFLPEIKRLLNNPDELRQRLEALRQIAKSWNSRSQAQKFLEIFEIMEKKRL